MNLMLVTGLSILVSILFVDFFVPNNTLGIDSDNQFQPEKIDSFPTVNDTALKVESVAEGLNFPSSMAFLDLNDILVTEKNNGTVQRIINGTIQPSPGTGHQRCH